MDFNGIVKNTFILLIIMMICFSSFNNSGYNSENVKRLFIVITILFIGSISIFKIGVIDFHAIISTASILVPATIIMGLLGQKIGEIMDNPKNKDDADYKLSVLNALKEMDKSVSLEELNDMLSKTMEEPDAPDADVETLEDES